MQLKVAEISERLTSRVDQVCQILLPGGRQKGAEWWAGDIRGGEGDSLKVQLSGAHAGNWRDWSSDEHGDLLDLWSVSKDLTLSEALREVKAFLGIQEEVASPQRKAYSKPPTEGTKPVAESRGGLHFLTKVRGLSQETVDQFKIEVFVDWQIKDVLHSGVAFPCYSPSGELINRSYRNVPKEGEKKVVWQDKGCAPCLFGWHALSPEAYRNRTVLLSEGQIDAMTWTQWGIPALSIPNGTGAAWVEYEWDNLAVFDHIYLSFDMDGAGAENAKKIIQRLGVHRCLLVSIPCKDANDCLKAGHTDAEAHEWIRKAKPPALNGLVLARDLEARVFEELREKKQPLTLPCFDLHWPNRGFYPHPGDVTVWTGPTGMGKSSFINFMILDLVGAAENVFIASMEITAPRIIRKLVTLWREGSVSEGEVKKFLNLVGDKLCFADVVGYIEPKKLLEMMLFAFRRYGCTRFFIDSLMRVKGLEEDYPAQGDFMNELAAFAKTYGVWVDIVCHPRKKQVGEKVNAMDIKGSSLIANNADNIASIIKNPAKEKIRLEGELTPAQDREMHDAEIRVDKQREVGWNGLFKLWYNQRTGNFSTSPPPEVVRQ